MSGASAEAIVDHPIVVRVAGDRHAGFYRVREGLGSAGGATAGVVVEAYRWGALTAGVAVRTASMLLLLPFMLGNLAVWLRPTLADRFGLLGGLCRLLAGSLTVAITLALVGVTMNLPGWQCVPHLECRDGRPYLSWLVALPMGPRLAVLALVPLLALRVFWAVGSRSARAFEGFGTEPARERFLESTASLAAPGIWHDERMTSWLRQIHVGLGAGTVDVALVVAVSHGRWNGVAVGLLGLAAGLVAFCAALLLATVPTGWAGPLRRLLWILVAVATVSSLGYAASLREVAVGVGQMPGYEGAVAGLFAAQGLLLVLIAAVTIVRQRTRPAGAHALLRGLGTPLVAAMSVTVASAYTTTLVFRTADQLDRGRIPDPIRPSPPALGPLEPPVAYWWAALAGLAALLVVTAAVAVTLPAARRRRRAYARRVVERDYPDVPASAAPRLHAVRETIASSFVTEELGPTLVAFFVVSSLGLATVALDLVGIGPTQLAARLNRRHDALAVLTAYVTDIGIWIISLLVVGLLVLGYRAYRSPETRRLVGVLWDLGTFWPRTVHPFAPPCYAARAVPELTRRVCALAARGPVVISGHSHGSVLAAATVLQLPPEALPRVALLTHGSPLYRVYARLYPAFLGERVLCDLGERIDWRWRNLWRDTDPIGASIFDHPDVAPDVPPVAATVDVRLRDPPSVTVAPADTVPPPVERHWPYHTQPEYQDAVRFLLDRMNRG
ncbi:hypothetical protein O7602_16370 [Micromonospora sp. WMMD1128]|uniref:hypothetical protein n=1 Tax=Micromonospora sp. WMMD1128 TaxID=3015150 RepID=UPI00248B3C4B|nr:hypothetical protein [Micromonospora sp. WMMD1128]WBB71336.1 hypothetical protein O7602_16370 [Micromonospora sp. WMMD1128]